jgi:hypothetical protein
VSQALTESVTWGLIIWFSGMARITYNFICIVTFLPSVHLALRGATLVREAGTLVRGLCFSIDFVDPYSLLITSMDKLEVHQAPAGHWS